MIGELEGTKESEAISDDELMGCYMHGFMDELDNNVEYDFGSPIKNKAYGLGRSHAFIGDDVRSVDYLSRQEIINMIKQKQ